MASRRTRRNLPQNQLDNSNPANWTSAQLKDALKGLGINITIPLSRGNLKKLYLDNVNNANGVSVSEPVESVVLETDMPVTDCSGDVTLVDSNVSAVRGTDLTNTTDRNFVESETVTEQGQRNHIDATRSNSNKTSSSAHQFDASSDDMGKLIVNTLQLCQQTMQQLSNSNNRQNTINYSLGSEPVPPTFNLHTAMAVSSTNMPSASYSPPAPIGTDQSCNRTLPIYSVNNSPRASFGVPSTSVADLDMISPEIRNQIISGKDVNLNLLLIPNYETPVKRKDQDKDERLWRNLSLDEFIVAFGRYKRIMCSAFSSRAEELELYLTHIIETAQIWPSKFFEYHKMFSAKCAIMLLQHNIKIDWSRGDIDLRQKICAGSRVNSCSKCNSTLHTTSMCPKKVGSNFPVFSKTFDTLGRDISYHDGRQVCNNFNWARGCVKPYCQYSHVCKQCKSTTHGKFNCNKSQEVNVAKQYQPAQKSVHVPTKK